MQTADGRPDWPWIVALLSLTALVVVGYMRIFIFWLTAYLSESREDRNRPLMDLAIIFLMCAICGYATSMLFFVWPAYRLLVFFLVILAFATWRFVFRLDRFRISLQARRLQRELSESVQRRNEELENLIAERTLDLEMARREADAANHAKSVFLANMSHEIRTPMTAILGYTELLSDELPASAHEAHDAINTVQRNGDYLMALINDVLDLSRVEAGCMEIESIPSNPAEIIEDVRRLLTNRADESGIGLSVRYTTPVPVTIETDPVRLRQVLVNLVGNAIKFTESGEVRIEIACDTSNVPLLRIRIVDTGIGIAASALEHIFEPFQQADASTVRRFGGTGLGLSISRQIVRRMGGDISVTSTPGRGSCFEVALPIAEEEAERLTTPETRVSRTKVPSNNVPGPKISGRVLLAEDGPDNQRLIAFHLRRAGADVTVVGDGCEAVRTVREASCAGNPFDLLVLDMQMPVMDGYAAANALRMSDPDLPILALTAHAMTGDRERCLEAGCWDFSTKPIDRRRLIEQASALLERGRVQSGHVARP